MLVYTAFLTFRRKFLEHKDKPGILEKSLLSQEKLAHGLFKTK